jgi:hypothetical protein
MALNGRINVDVLFHDTDGTTSLKVVSLEDSTEYTSGKVAVVTGTVGVAPVTVLQAGDTTYRDASGQVVSFGTAATSVAAAFVKVSADNILLSDGSNSLFIVKDFPTAIKPQGSTITLQSPGPTASYTLVFYGD